MHGMGGQILPRGYLGITPPDVECIHGLGGMDSTMEHACATSRADKNPDGSEIQVLHSIRLSIGQNGLAIVYIGVKFQLPEKFPKKGGNLGGKNRIKSQTPWRCKSITQGSVIRVLFDSQENEITVA